MTALDTNYAALDAFERAAFLRTRHRQTLAMRWLLAAIVALLAVADSQFDVIPAPAVAVAAVAAVLLAGNAVAAVLLERARFAAWQFWVLFGLDTAAVVALAYLGGPSGAGVLPFVVMIVAGQALGYPIAARVHLGVAAALYPVARLTSVAHYHFALSGAQVAIETLCLAGVGWLATMAPAINTFRVRRARAALAALERGEFDVRLPERALDDLGFLAVSFNRTAVALGSSVRALHEEIAERERAELARRESEARLHAAEDEAQTTEARMRALAVAAASVLSADTIGTLHDVLRDACWQVFDFDAFAVAVHNGAEDTWHPLGDSDAVLLDPDLCSRVLRERRSLLLDVPSGASATCGAGPIGSSTLMTPIFGAAEVLGLLALRSDRAGSYRASDTEVSEALAALAATALRNIRLMDELRYSREAFAHQAHHDPLTGLANRARLHERMAHALRTTPLERLAILVLDLDGFKRVNDSLGHAAGDQLLCEVSQRLLNATRGSDTVARLGGDEFAILLENARSDADAITVAERIITALRIPFVIDTAEAVVGTSVGIARPAALPTCDGEGVAPPPREAVDERVDAMLRDADLAMYRAKTSGKGRYCFFEPEMHAEAVGRLALEADLRAALVRGEFRLVYQPIVDLDSGDPAGVEALLRWHHPVRGTVPPLDFIPLAEETGIIVALGRWVLAAACAQVRRWDAARGAAGRPPLTLTVNVSGRQLYEAGFVGDVFAALEASELEPSRLVLELTESVMIDRPELALERFSALKALGVRLAIDDFGTGYSALSYLQRFPIDVLKIDKSFVDGLKRGGPQAALARTIVALGRALSLRTIAEGIEEPEQRAALRDVGCPLGQGYLFARPLEAAAVDELLAAVAPASHFLADATAEVGAFAAI